MGSKAANPAVFTQEIGNRPNRVGMALEELRLAVTVSVDRIAPPTAWHKLRDAQGAGKRALEALEVKPLLVRQEQQRGQLISKKGGATLIEKPECREGVDGWKIPQDSAVAGLDAQDADDHSRRHAMGLEGLSQGC